MSLFDQSVSSRLCGAFSIAFVSVAILTFLGSESHARPEMAGQKTAEDRYVKMDADKDGKVTSQEFFAAYPQMKEGAFKAIDENGDGIISLEEWKTFAAGHKSSDPHAGQGGGMGGAAPQGEKSANATGGTGKDAMPSLIMPHGVGK